MQTMFGLNGIIVTYYANYPDTSNCASVNEVFVSG
jgi:hypothetical protein